jgi:hypothetical protein
MQPPLAIGGLVPAVGSAPKARFPQSPWWSSRMTSYGASLQVLKFVSVPQPYGLRSSRYFPPMKKQLIFPRKLNPNAIAVLLTRFPEMDPVECSAAIPRAFHCCTSRISSRPVLLFPNATTASGARSGSMCTARFRGFESHSLRQTLRFELIALFRLSVLKTHLRKFWGADHAGVEL